VSEARAYIRKIRALTIVDDFTRESPAIDAGFYLGVEGVMHVLEDLRVTFGLPPSIVLGNGPELNEIALDK
jgi:putative transposase